MRSPIHLRTEGRLILIKIVLLNVFPGVGLGSHSLYSKEEKSKGDFVFVLQANAKMEETVSFHIYKILKTVIFSKYQKFLVYLLGVFLQNKNI